VVLPFGVLVASVDELHQTSVSSRTGSIRDVMIDVIGLSVGLLLVWLTRRRGRVGMVKRALVDRA
jgi:VanZ family protein